MRAILLATALASILLLPWPPATATPPADAFCVITIEASDDWRIVRYTIDEETNLTQREQLFGEVDHDGSGSVTPAEKDKLRRQTLKAYPDASGLGLAGVQIVPAPTATPTPLRALTVNAWREVGHTFHQRDYRTPDVVTEAADMETQAIREFRFAFDPAGDLQHVGLSGGAPLYGEGPDGTTTTTTVPPHPPAIEYVVVRAPPGWLVTRVNGWTYDGPVRLLPNAQVVDVPAFDTKRPYTIDFGRGTDATTETSSLPDTSDSPPDTGQESAPSANAGSLAPAMAIVLLAALAVAVRRKMGA